MPRPLRSLALALLVSTAAAATAPGLPPRIKASTDEAVFHRFVLENGLRVMLVSDPRFNLSAATLAVNVGALDDPPDREGLTHFLEHMISRGNAKYPAVDGLSDFVGANGGYRNASTSGDATSYLFEIRHEALAEALDRTAQVFISPLFPADFTTREINAVHNEAMRHVQNDERRRISVLRELYAAGSPERKFSTGNKDTLAGTTGADVRAHWERNYSADRMALAVAGKASIAELERMVRAANFGGIARRELAARPREPLFLPHRPALRLACIEPVREARELRLEFVIPSPRANFISKPERLVALLLGHAGTGGLEDRLKRDGLANAVSAGALDRTSGYGSFTIHAALTPDGEKAPDQVLQAIFGYLAFLRTAPFPVRLHDELAQIARLEETHGDRGEGVALTNKLASQMVAYPLEVAERATDVWGAPDEAAYRDLLGRLTPDNLMVTLMARGVPTDRQDRIYHTAYSYREDTGPAYLALTTAAPAADFALPGLNRFLGARPVTLAERPWELIAERGLQLYYSPDTEFERPQAAVRLRLVPPRDFASLEHEALLNLYSACLNEFLMSAAGEAARAGVDAGVGATLQGLTLHAAGFGDSALRYVTYVSEHLRDFSVSPERFEARKEAVLRALRSREQDEAATVAQTRRSLVAQEFDFAPAELVPVVAAATFADVQALSRRLLARGKLEAVVHGHVTAAQAIDFVREVGRRIGAEPVAPEALLRRRYLLIAPGEEIIDAAPIEGVNSVFVRDYLLPDDSPPTRAAALVIASFIRNPFFTELRSRQQLGYIVSSSSAAVPRDRHLRFTIQSSVYPPDELKRRVEAFLPTLPRDLAAVTPERWAALIAGARSSLESKPKSIAERAQRHFLQAFDFNGDWEQRNDTLRALETLTREQASILLAEVLAPETSRRRTFLLWSKSLPLTEAVAPTFSDRAAWKATRTFQ
jgi:insulysin